MSQHEEPTAHASALPPGTYAIHEWGFLAHHHTDTRGSYIAGAVPAEYRHPLGRGGGKPILYVHLAPGLETARFDVNLGLAEGGAFQEHWPPTEMVDGRLHWAVQARPQFCTGQGRYPTARDAACSEISDHYCEAAELGAYETQDAACLVVNGGQHWNHLFYRARLAGDLPIRVTKEGDGFVVHNDGASPMPGQLMRISRANQQSGTSLVRFDAPALGAQAPVPSTDGATNAPEGIAGLRAELAQLGMTADETRAFMAAWEPELFGESESVRRVRMVGHPPPTLQPKADALVYFLPAAVVDALAPLTVSPPAARIHRAMLVRIDLTERVAPPQGTIGLGNLGNLGLPGPSGHEGEVGSPARVRLERVQVRGELPMEVVRRVVRRHQGELRRCYQELDTETRARVTLQWTIGASGDVTASDASVSEGPAALEQCMATAVRRWVFPAPVAGEVNVRQPVQLFRDPGAGDLAVRGTTFETAARERAAPAGRARVRLGTVEVQGALPVEVVRRVVRRHLGELRACYEELDTEVDHRANLRFTINAAGRVLNANASDGDGPSALVRCLATAMRRWTFPTEGMDGVAIVQQPVFFSRE